MESTVITGLKFAWEYYILRRHRVPAVAIPPDYNFPASDPWLLKFLVGMYRGHGAEAVQTGNWICVDRGRLFTRAAHFNHRMHPKNLVLQTDFITIAPTGQQVVESFAGVGTDVQSALHDACRSYQDSTFHALLVALLDRPCDHVERETWTIAGTQRRVTIGMLRTRGKLPFDLWPPVFEGFQRLVQNFDLPTGLHWFRLFYSSSPDDEPILEVLLDNEVCERLQIDAALLPWPRGEDFYTVRVFFTVQDT